MLDINTSSRTEQRKFGFLMAGAFVVLGLIRFALHGFSEPPYGFLILAALFAAPAALWPPVLKPVLIVWIKFALLLNWIITHLMLTIVYFLIIAPMGVMMRLFSEDPLKRKWLAAPESYWEAPEEQPGEFERYLNQF